MGCDIHAYIDYDARPNLTWYFAGPLFIPRDYKLFGLLAGVRTEGPPIVEPRGIPPMEMLSYQTQSEFYLAVTESRCGWGGCHITTPEDAVKYGQKMVNKHFATDADHHTPSWLTAGELRQVVQRYDESAGGLSGARRELQEVRAALAAMLMLDENEEGRSRLVFWFDS